MAFIRPSDITHELYTLREIPSFTKMDRFSDNVFNAGHILSYYDHTLRISDDGSEDVNIAAGDLILTPADLNTTTDPWTVNEPTWATDPVMILKQVTRYVGIGTINPVSPLEVSAASSDITPDLLMITNTTTSRGAGIAFKNEALGVLAGIYGQYDGTGPRGIITFHTANSGSPAERIRITREGNLGVGTTAPQNKLDVSGSAVVGASYAGTNTAPSNGLLIEGNVGIGTTSASVPLEVSGAIRTSSDVLTASVRAKDATGLSLKDDSGTVGVFVEDGGQVGIRTNSPGYDLHVLGTSTTVAAFSMSTYSSTRLYVSIGDGVRSLGEYASVSSSNINFDSGKIGIGKTSPNYPVHVGQTAGFDSYVYFTAPVTHYSYINFNRNEAQNMKLHRTTGVDPSGLQDGMIWMRTDVTP